MRSNRSEMEISCAPATGEDRRGEGRVRNTRRINGRSLRNVPWNLRIPAFVVPSDWIEKGPTHVAGNESQGLVEAHRRGGARLRIEPFGVRHVASGGQRGRRPRKRQAPA